MTTFYDDGPVRVTSEALRIGPRAYPLAELGQVWHQRGRRSWGVLANRGALLMAIVGPLVAAVFGIVVALKLHTSPTVTVAIVGVSILLGLAVGPVADLLLEHVDSTYTRGSHPLEIWAQWRGVPVRLLHTRDALRFGKIYRALQRAMEQTAAPARRS
nr:DUF6232 family protein [Micromonospora sp. DSM 115978]